MTSFGVRAKSMLVACAVVATVLAAGSAGLVFLLDGALHSQAETSARIQAAQVAALVAGNGGHAGSEHRAVLPPAAAGVYVQLVSVHGRVVAANTRAAYRQAFVAPRGVGASGVVQSVGYLPGVDEDPYIVLAEPFSAALDGTEVSRSSGSGLTVEVAEPIAWPVHVEHLVTAALALGVPALVVLVGLLVWWLAGRALAPVEDIRAQVDAVSSRELHRRVLEPSGGDEIARLARTMNAMLERLERSADRERQFTSDASHELRSPLASLQTQLEVAVEHPDTERWDELAVAMLDDVQRMRELVDDLLLLARSGEGGSGRATPGPVDLDELVLVEAHRLRSAGTHHPERSGRPLIVDTTGVKAARVLGDARSLGRVVRNLADNAARHAVTKVSFVLYPDGRQAVLEISDDGSGIAAADRERIFERFTRLDEARNVDQGGSGLGLAIVRQVVLAHGGSVHVEDAQPPGEWNDIPLAPPDGGPGARFVVRLPALTS